MQHTQQCIDLLMGESLIGNIAVRVGRHDRILLDICQSKSGTVDQNTLFDMASVSKILAVTSLALIALDQGLIGLGDPAARFFRCDSGMEKVTIKHLMTHTIGVGHKPLNRPENTCDNIAEYILRIPPDIPVGSDVLYSCPAFIVLGKILEKVFGKPLNILAAEMVFAPLAMNSTGYRPKERTNIVNSNTDSPMLGVVNDYNCRHLGGVAGNAGVFSNITDLTAFARMLLRRGSPLFSEEIFKTARQNHTAGMSEARGLGYVYVDERYPQTGSLFPAGSIGHCGHTGQSVFVHPESGLYAIILSDATLSTVKKYGHEDYGRVMQMRAELHNAVKADLDEIPG